MEHALTVGRIAYEASVAAQPNYHDGSRRKTWEQLGKPEQATWERNPSPVTDFPCTLADIGRTSRLVHVTAEMLGFRYYVGSGSNFAEGRVIAAHYREHYPDLPDASFYLVDRNDATRIHGGPAEFAEAIARSRSTGG
jgi:hypothetical protein